MAQWAETWRRIFNFLILINSVRGLIDEINLRVLYYRKTQGDGSYQSENHTFAHCMYVGENILDVIGM